MPTPRTRLSKEERRTQLLDAAETLLIERGTPALTMERLAEYAGVSKALPYSHFDNSDEVLVAVYQRVVFELGRRVVETLEQSSDEDDRVALVVNRYFDTVRELGPILGVVTAPGSRASELADGDRRIGVHFLADLLVKYFGAEPKRAKAAAPILLAALTGALNAWATGHASRRDAEELTATMIRSVL